MEHKMLARRPLGNPRRAWKQDHYILSVASAGPMYTTLDMEDEFTLRKTRRAVKTCMDAGFNLIGCLWASSKMAMEIVRTAESLGGNVLFQDLKRFGGMGDKNVFCETNDYSGAIRDTAQWNCIKGYCMWDEPITEKYLWRTREMIDYCNREHPDLLPYTVANPDYHQLFCQAANTYAPYIERFLEVIDPVQMSFDYYPIGRKEYDPALQLDNSSMWYDLEVVRRAAQAHGVPLWFYYQGQRFPWHKIYYTFKFPMVRAMAHAGVLYGAKGLECYTEFDGFVNPETGKCGVFFEEQKRLNAELKGLGDVLMALTCLRVIHDDTLLPGHALMDEIRTSMEESELLEGTLTPRVSVSEHTDDYGNRYLMVLNRDYNESTMLDLKLKNTSCIYAVSKEDGEQVLVHHNSKHLPIYLEPGDLALYRIQNAEEDPYTVEYYLEKPCKNLD